MIRPVNAMAFDYDFSDILVYAFIEYNGNCFLGIYF